MQITEVKIRKLTNETKMRAIASVIFEDCLAVHDIKIIASNDKLFLSMPSRKRPDGSYADIVHPTTSALRHEIEAVVLAEYQKVYKESIENFQKPVIIESIN